MTDPAGIPAELQAVAEQGEVAYRARQRLDQLIHAARDAGHSDRKIATAAGMPVPYVRAVLSRAVSPPGLIPEPQE